jgi:hypothetical protein
MVAAGDVQAAVGQCGRGMADRVRGWMTAQPERRHSARADLAGLTTSRRRQVSTATSSTRWRRFVCRCSTCRARPICTSR